MCSYFVRSVLCSNLKITNIFHHSPLRPDDRHWPPASGAASRCRDDLRPRLFVAECGRSEMGRESGLINIAPTITLSGTKQWHSTMSHNIFILGLYTGSRVWDVIWDTHKVLDPDVAAAEDEGGDCLSVARAGGQVQRSLSVLKQRNRKYQENQFCLIKMRCGDTLIVPLNGWYLDSNGAQIWNLKNSAKRLKYWLDTFIVVHKASKNILMFRADICQFKKELH